MSRQIFFKPNGVEAESSTCNTSTCSKRLEELLSGKGKGIYLRGSTSCRQLWVKRNKKSIDGRDPVLKKRSFTADMLVVRVGRLSSTPLWAGCLVQERSFRVPKNGLWSVFSNLANFERLFVSAAKKTGTCDEVYQRNKHDSTISNMSCCTNNRNRD